MRSQPHHLPVYGTLAAVLLLGAAAVAPAAAATDPGPIGPGQYFTGQVNGVSEKAVIQVVCAGPVSGTSTGHPVAKQTVDVVAAPSSSSADIGYTGDAADHVLVDFGNTTTSTALTLQSYEAKAEIPTALNLPCSGTGKVAFVPAPTSNTARSSTIVVTYENIAV